MYFTQCDETTYKFMFNTLLGIREKVYKKNLFLHKILL